MPDHARNQAHWSVVNLSNLASYFAPEPCNDIKPRLTIKEPAAMPMAIYRIDIAQGTNTTVEPCRNMEVKKVSEAVSQPADFVTTLAPHSSTQRQASYGEVKP